MTVASRRRAAVSRATPRYSVMWSLVTFFALFAAVSRGVFEFLLSKNAAYIVQLSVILVFVVLLLLFGRPHRRPKMKWAVVALYGFVLAALISLWLSANLEGITFGGTYVVVTIFYATLLVVFSCVRFEVATRINFGVVLSVIGLLLLIVAVAQQFGGFTLLPGSDRGTFGTFARPSSLTGSFLHYPLAGALIGVALLGIGQQRSRPRFVLIGVILLGGVALSLSRSGIVIVLVAIAAGVFLTPNLAARARNTIAVLLLGLVVLFVLPSDLLVSRVLSIFQTDGSGNQTRIRVWTNVLELWANSPVLFGSHAGAYTNVTSNLTDTMVTVTESGVLQLLISFGLVGLICYYALLFSSVRASPAVPPWFRAAAIAGIAQSAVYQSIEVFPFMVVFAMLPFIADGGHRQNAPGDGDITESRRFDRRRRPGAVRARRATASAQ